MGISLPSTPPIQVSGRLGELDIAQPVGLSIKGDAPLKMHCAVADMNVKRGLFEPRVMVIVTDDSVVSVDGSLSLANESLNLRAVVLPKDFSQVSLRAPLNVRGNFSNPQVSIEKQALTLKLAGSLLLGLLNPLASIIPLIDSGEAAQAQNTSPGHRRDRIVLFPLPSWASVLCGSALPQHGRPWSDSTECHIAWPVCVCNLCMQLMYATYDLTDLATLKVWPIGSTIIDIGWGVAASTLAACAGKFAPDRLCST